jgi:mRNA-degrading endonuclease RelE of RelBE toxin-antitoxin system
MKRALRLSEQAIGFHAKLAPDARRAVKSALRGLGEERGDLRALEGTLTGFHRLRVGRYRAIFAYADDGAIDVVFVESRAVAYEVFEAEIIRRLKETGD